MPSLLHNCVPYSGSVRNKEVLINPILELSRGGKRNLCFPSISNESALIANGDTSLYRREALLNHEEPLINQRFLNEALSHSIPDLSGYGAEERT